VGIKPISLIHPSKVIDVLTAMLLSALRVSDRVLDGVSDEGLDGGSDHDFDLLQANQNVRSS
jgi:hypothetical protein